jgi:bacterioferritin (cytochrome b1)
VTAAGRYRNVRRDDDHIGEPVIALLGGLPGFSLGTPRIGKRLSEVLHNDLDAQANVRPVPKAAGERVVAAHDRADPR